MISKAARLIQAVEQSPALLPLATLALFCLILAAL